MQPGNTESNAIQPGFEQGQVGVTPSNGEHVPVLPTPEQGIERGAERREQTADAAAAVVDAASVGAMAQPIQPAIDPATVVPAAGTSPAVAADDDVIEKEWVDKAKKILEETKDDPHGRTNRVNELQKDYLKKRYGKELGAST